MVDVFECGKHCGSSSVRASQKLTRFNIKVDVSLGPR